MDCTKMRDLIITDYIDNEATQAVRNEIKAHLAVCPVCSVFEKELRMKVSEPLRRLEPATPPESIWQGIRGAIEEEEAAHAPSFVQRLAGFLAGAFTVRTPTLALSAAFVVVLVSAAVLLPLYRQWTVKVYLRQQSEFISSLSYPVNGESGRGASFGTAIEDVFLGELS